MYLKNMSAGLWIEFYYFYLCLSKRFHLTDNWHDYDVFGFHPRRISFPKTRRVPFPQIFYDWEGLYMWTSAALMISSLKLCNSGSVFKIFSPEPKWRRLVDFAGAKGEVWFRTISVNKKSRYWFVFSSYILTRGTANNLLIFQSKFEFFMVEALNVYSFGRPSRCDARELLR